MLVAQTPAPIEISQGVVVLAAVLGLVLQFMALYVALKRAISAPIEKEIANQAGLLTQQLHSLRQDLKEEHDGLGNRIQPLELGARERDTRLTTIEREEGLVRERHAYMAEKIGALEANQKAFNEQMRDLAADLHETIVESGKAQTTALNTMALQFATFQASHETEKRVRREIQVERRRRRREANRDT